jgi:L-lactate dehydrogenase complex protein LldG
MNKEEMLERIRNHRPAPVEMPVIDDMQAISYPDKVAQFIAVMKSVGGDAVELPADADINRCIRTRYPEAKVIASNLPEITIATRNPDEAADPHELNGTDLAVVRGAVGVAENGCVWIPQNVRQKALYFISEYLVILLDKQQLVNNMHEAYRRIEVGEQGFGVFISGPSKTADIEQALVVGAHGARGVTVILLDA